jgi:hypothetical protein
MQSQDEFQTLHFGHEVGIFNDEEKEISWMQL